jgi:hypothetical protein
MIYMFNKTGSPGGQYADLAVTVQYFRKDIRRPGITGVELNALEQVGAFLSSTVK